MFRLGIGAKLLSSAGSKSAPGIFTAGVPDADLATDYTSGAVIVDAAVAPGTAISITGGTYSKNYDFYTSSDGTVNPNDTLFLRATSSSSVSTAVVVSVTIGSKVSTWTITTATCLLNRVTGAVAAWSCARQLIDTYVSGTFMTQSAGVVTSLKEQIAGRDAAPSGSPAVGTGTIGSSAFIKFDETNDKLSFTSLSLAGDWTAAFAFGTGKTSAGFGTLIGSTASTCSIRGTTGTSFDLRSNNAGPVTYNTLYAGAALGFHVMVVTRVGTTVTIYWNGDAMGSPVGRTVTGVWTFDQFGVSSTSTAWSAMGLGEGIIWDRVLSAPEIATVTANMKNAYPNGTFVDFTAGNDSNLGWNESVPLKTIGAARVKVYRRGTKIRLKRGEVWRRDPLLLNITNQGGSSGDHLIVNSYGSGELPKLIGSELMNPAGWTNTTGTEYSQTLTGLSNLEEVWAVKGTTTVETRPGTTFNIPSVRRLVGGGTAGALALNTFANTGTLITINIGESPATWDVEVGHEGNGYADNQGHLVRLAAPYVSVMDIQGWFASVDCFYHDNQNTSFYRTQSWYAKADGHGGAGANFYEEECLSYFSGKGRVSSGPDGDAFSAHQGSTGIRLRPTGILADKAGIDDGDDCVVTNYAAYVRGCNRNLFNYDSPVGGFGTLTFIYPIIVRSIDDGGYCAEFSNQVNAVLSHATFINEGDLNTGTAIRHNTTESTIVTDSLFYGFEFSIEDDNSGTLTNDYNLQDTGCTYGPGVSAGVHDITDDPDFVDVGNRDFKLDTGSPGIGDASDGGNIGAL